MEETGFEMLSLAVERAAHPLQFALAQSRANRPPDGGRNAHDEYRRKERH
jgi:hypothetical protein